MLRAFFFVYFGATGILLPFMGPYLRGLGFSGQQIAVALSLSPFLGLVMPLLWAWVADRNGRHVAVLRGLCLGLLVGAVALLFARQYAAILAAMSWMALFSSGVVPLADAMASATIEQTQSYARTRLWGSVGFAVTSVAGGVLLDRPAGSPSSALDVPVLLIAAYALAALVALRLTVRGDSGERPRLDDMRQLFADPRLRLLVAIAGLHWGVGAPYMLLFGILVKDLELSTKVTGYAVALGVVVEIVVLHQFSRLAQRFTRERMLAVALAATALRWLLVSRATSPAALIALQAIHGLTFGLFWAATVALLTEYVPRSLKASGLALLGAALAGGNLVGYYAAGVLYDASGSAATAFAVAGLAELVPLALLLRFRALRALKPAA